MMQLAATCDTTFQHDVRLSLFILLIVTLLTFVLAAVNWWRNL